MSPLTSAIAADLVLRLRVREGRLELLLPMAVRRKGDARLGLALRLQLDHVAGEVEHGGGDAFLVLGPRRRSKLGEDAGMTCSLRRTSARGRSSEDGDEDPHRVGELEDQVLLLLFALVQQLHAAVDADAVRQVDDQVPFAEFQKAVDRPRLVSPRRRASRRNSVRPNSSWSLRTTIPAVTRRKPRVTCPRQSPTRPASERPGSAMPSAGLSASSSASRARSPSLWQAISTCSSRPTQRFQFGKRFGPWTLETLDRFDPQMASRVVSCRRQWPRSSRTGNCVSRAIVACTLNRPRASSSRAT